MSNNFALRRDVLDELEWEPGIDAASIGVTVHEGTVGLTGSVKTYTEKLAAEQVVERVHGVRGIANDIEVRLPGFAERNDAEIARSAVDALLCRTFVPSDRIKAIVNDGWIRLEGHCDWQHQKDAAFEAVRHLIGVKGVTNAIVLKPHVSAIDVKGRIESALRRSAALDAQKVRVETHDGKVTLRGDVHSLAERLQAERTVWAAPGVTQVENLITVNA